MEREERREGRDGRGEQDTVAWVLRMCRNWTQSPVKICGIVASFFPGFHWIYTQRFWSNSLGERSQV